MWPFARIRVIMAFIAAFTAGAVFSPAWGEAPSQIVISGALGNAEGVSLAGSRAYAVTCYDAAADGNVIGAPIEGTVEVSAEGLFNIAVEPPDGIRSAPAVWYGLAIDSDTPPDGVDADDVFPDRVRLYSVPYALQAQEVMSVSAEQIANGTVDDTEFEALDGVTGNIQAQIDAIDTSGIAVNAAAIEQNSQDIAANTAAIVQNSQYIAVNTVAIGQNALGIASNAAAIALKADAADVYSRAEAEAAFVEVSGDTMTGALAISDTTASADPDTGALVIEGGAGIEGDLHIGGEMSTEGTLRVRGLSLLLGNDNSAFAISRAAAPSGKAGGVLRIEGQDGDAGFNGGDLVLTPGAGDGGANPGGVQITDRNGAPADTSDKLYNNGGDLFWNGVKLNAAGVGETVSSAEIENGAIVDEDISDSADIAASKLASNVMVSGENVSDLANDAGYLSAVVSADITNGTIVNEDVSDSADIAASKLASNVMVSGENVSELANDAGYLTTESDTLSTVTGRGASTGTQVTLSGGVRVNTISEATLNNGVSIDGVKAKDSTIELGLIAVPVTVTNRLYNVNDTLYWNGAAISGVILPSQTEKVSHDAVNIKALAPIIYIISDDNGTDDSMTFGNATEGMLIYVYFTCNSTEWLVLPGFGDVCGPDGFKALIFIGGKWRKVGGLDAARAEPLP